MTHLLQDPPSDFTVRPFTTTSQKAQFGKTKLASPEESGGISIFSTGSRKSSVENSPTKIETSVAEKNKKISLTNLEGGLLVAISLSHTITDCLVIFRHFSISFLHSIYKNMTARSLKIQPFICHFRKILYRKIVQTGQFFLS